MIKRFVLFASVAAASLAASAQTDSIASPKRPIWPDIVTSGASTAIVNAAATEILKHSVREWRPNLENDRAFPSRHTSWAFAASTFLSNSFYRELPWLPLASQAAASAVGLQRVHCGAHYGGDVAAGMALGIGSAVLSDFVAGWIFGRPPHFESAAASFRPSVELTSGVMLPLRRSRGWRSGYSAGVRGVLPLSGRWGIAATAGAFAVSRNNPGHTVYTPALEGLTISGGGVWQISPSDGPFAVSVRAEAGAAYLRRWSARWAFTATAAVGLRRQLTPRFGAALEAGCSHLTSANLTAFTIAATSAYTF